MVLMAAAEQLISALTPKVPGAPDPIGGEGAPGIDMKPTIKPEEAKGPSKINAELLAADGQAPPPAIAAPGVAPGTGPLPQAPPVIVPGAGGSKASISGTGQLPTDDLDVVQIPEGPAAGPAGMSLEEKMAMAAQLGSLLRGPGAPRPPGAPGGGGPGINMQPVFLRDLRG